MARRIQALLALPLFLEVSDTRDPVRLTPIFARRPEYRRFLTIYTDFQMGIAGVLGDFLNVPLARTFDLYEIWVFLRIARAASLLFPESRIDVGRLFQPGCSGEVLLAKGTVCVEVSERIVLCFQRTYREFWLEPSGVGSYSREMRPDLSLESLDPGRGPKSLIVLDAKYRVDEKLNEAIASIHMYRDAIVRSDPGGERQVVAGAYLLAPQLPIVGEDWRKAAMPGRLFHPEYRGKFRFGAVCLQPGMELDRVGEVLEEILRQSGVAMEGSGRRQD